MLQRLTPHLHRLIRADQTVLVAVSGGADSIALLHALVALQPQLNIHLTAATYDHQLRAASAADAAYVQALCAAWDVPCVVGHMDAHPQANIEATARESRYRFLAQAAQQVGASAVLTAHHADDQAETVLLHILRGAGLKGLRGMAWRSPLPYADAAAKLDLIRPMLQIRRADILAYCAAHNLSPREDATNTDLTFTRNRLRHEVMPRLVDIQPDVVAALSRLAEAAQLDYALIDSLTDSALAACMRLRGDGFLLLDAPPFMGLHPALQRHVLMRALHDVFPQSVITQERVQAALRLIAEGGVGAQAEFAGGHLTLMYDGILVGDVAAYLRHRYHYMLMPAGRALTVPVPGTITVDDWQLNITLHPPPVYQARLNLQGAEAITVRTRQPGDTWQPMGMGGHRQKLKAWMIDRKIPQALRDCLPLIIVQGQIAAIVYGEAWPIAEGFKGHEKANLDVKNAFFVIFYKNE